MLRRTRETKSKKKIINDLKKESKGVSNRELKRTQEKPI